MGWMYVESEKDSNEVPINTDLSPPHILPTLSPKEFTLQCVACPSEHAFYVSHWSCPNVNPVLCFLPKVVDIYFWQKTNTSAQHNMYNWLEKVTNMSC